MRTRRFPWLLVLAIWLFFFLAMNSMVMDSPTMDEQNHLARGVAFVRTGDPRLSLEHPPLVNGLSGLPVAWLLPGVRLPLDDPSWARQPPDVYWYVFANLFLWEVNADVTRMIFLGRLPIVFLTLGLALIGYRFARSVWGRAAGVTAFVLLLFDPNVLAHGRYITTDLGGAAFVLLASWALWRLWRAPGWAWRRWLVAALCLGLAFGSKLSALAFVPIWGLLAALPAAAPGWRGAGRRLAQLGTAGLASIGVVWAIFGFEWGALRLETARLGWLNGRSAPMPTFWAGIEQILQLSEGGRYDAFLRGQFSSSGFASYFPQAFLMKTPLPALLLFGVGAGVLLANGRTRRRALFLLLPPLAYLLVSMQSTLNIGYRHLLPMLPFLYVLAAGLVVGAGRWRRAAVALLVVLQVGTAVSIHPHYLSYFNQAVGGPENGYRLLTDSNVDWGQDLLRLRAWLAERGETDVRLGWFGTADPAYYGVPHDPLPGFPLPAYLSQWGAPPFDPAQPAPGLYAISASSLWELPLRAEEKGVYAWFRAREPDARVGYSILIYQVRE